MIFQLFSIFSLLFFIFCQCLNREEKIQLEIYKLSDCDNPKRCLPGIFKQLGSQSNEQFLISSRTNLFKKLIEENDQNDEQKVYFEDTFLVYSFMNSAIVADIQRLTDGDKNPDYTSEEFKRLEQLFLYVGSGDFYRMEEHLLFLKSTCPKPNEQFAHYRIAPIYMYMCTLLSYSFVKDNRIPFVFIYPVIAVTKIKVARKLEKSLITALGDILLNIQGVENTHTDDSHFLSHYLIEYSLRFIKNEFENVKFDHEKTPFFELHKMLTYGYYDDANIFSPKKLPFQGQIIYQYEEQSFSLINSGNVAVVSPVVFLPFGTNGIDYQITLNNKKYVIHRLTTLMEFMFEKNVPDFLDCFNEEVSVLDSEFTSTLKQLIGQLYYILDACILYPNRQKSNKLELNFNADLLQRLKSKFEYCFLTTLYIDAGKKENVYVDWKHEPDTELFSTFPTNFEGRCKEIEKFVGMVDQFDQIDDPPDPDKDFENNIGCPEDQNVETPENECSDGDSSDHDEERSYNSEEDGDLMDLT